MFLLCNHENSYIPINYFSGFFVYICKSRPFLVRKRILSQKIRRYPKSPNRVGYNIKIYVYEIKSSQWKNGF